MSVLAGAQPQATSHATVDRELLLDLIGWAAKFAATRPANAALPTLEALPDELLVRTVCPEQGNACRGLVAAYDTDRRRIVYRASLDIREPADQSFIVHELVHWLQRNEGLAGNGSTCASVIEAERGAYVAQNRYLDHFRQWQRVGEMLRFMACNAEDTDEAAAPAVRFDASTRPITVGPVAPQSQRPR